MASAYQAKKQPGSVFDNICQTLLYLDSVLYHPLEYIPLMAQLRMKVSIH